MSSSTGGRLSQGNVFHGSGESFPKCERGIFKKKGHLRGREVVIKRVIELLHGKSVFLELDPFYRRYVSLL